MKSPPRNANAALAKRRREKLIDVPGCYQARGLAQAAIIWNRWQREASRLFAEYWKTGDPRHLAAFCRHAHGMRVHVRGAR
jgi:hypothetical protein